MFSRYDNTGGRYNPISDLWLATSLTSAPSARAGHTAVWTGREMIVWGGGDESNSFLFFDTGGRYDPSTNSWIDTSTTGAPSGRQYHTAVWTGGEMIVWGGDVDDTAFASTGGRYCAQSGPTPTPNRNTNTDAMHREMLHRHQGHAQHQHRARSFTQGIRKASLIRL